MKYFCLDHPPDRLILCHRSNCKGIADYMEVSEQGDEDFVCAAHTSSVRHASVLPKAVPTPAGAQDQLSADPSPRPGKSFQPAPVFQSTKNLLQRWHVGCLARRQVSVDTGENSIAIGT
ncbi:MAG: hypothetical protein WB523_06425 [Candidatus Sulfotelmatobacter sp.]